MNNQYLDLDRASAIVGVYVATYNNAVNMPVDYPLMTIAEFIKFLLDGGTISKDTHKLLMRQWVNYDTWQEPVCLG